jgi:hypothetical protein
MKVKSYLDIDFCVLFQSHLPASLIIEELYRIIYAFIELYVPSKCTVISKRSRLLKYPPTIRRKLQKKAAAWRNYRTHKTAEALIVFLQDYIITKQISHLLIHAFDRESLS